MRLLRCLLFKRKNRHCNREDERQAAVRHLDKYEMKYVPRRW